MHFNLRAGSFDQRAGLPREVCQKIAETVMTLGRMRSQNRLLELGAGTGQIGVWFEGVRYIGLDISREMLTLFQRRMGNGCARALVLGDGNYPWPLADGATHVVFSSRTIHWLKVEHLARELLRVASPEGATFFIGRVRRQKGSVISRMRSQMRRILRKRGFVGRDGEVSHHRIIEVCCEQGASVLEPMVVARWVVTNTPAQSLCSWEQNSGLAGLDPPTEVKREVLETLRIWSERTFGSIHTEVQSEECYILEGVRFPPR